MNTSINTIAELNTLSNVARQLFAEILIEGGMANRAEFAGRPGWEELIEEDLVNCWDDDQGRKWCHVGRQQV